MSEALHPHAAGTPKQRSPVHARSQLWELFGERSCCGPTQRVPDEVLDATFVFFESCECLLVAPGTTSLPRRYQSEVVQYVLMPDARSSRVPAMYIVSPWTTMPSGLS